MIIRAMALAVQPLHFPLQNQHDMNNYTACNFMNQNTMGLCVGFGFIPQATKGGLLPVTTAFKGEPTLKWEEERNGVNSVDVKTLCREGQLKEALGFLQFVDQRGISLDSHTYAFLLKACADIKALAEGKKVHAHMLMSGIQLNLFLLNTIVSMYSKCGSMVDAHKAFDQMFKRNVFTWNAMIRGYSSNGQWEEALTLYHQMLREGLQPDNFTFPSVIQACAGRAPQLGKEIHACVIKSGFESDIFVGNTLITMYAKSGCAEDACQVFDRMSHRNVVSWTSMIAMYVRNGQGDQAFKFFSQMQFEAVKPDSITFATVLAACAQFQALKEGKEIHDYVRSSSLESDLLVGNALVAMYAKCGSVVNARQVFDDMSQRDVMSWTAMIAGYVQNGSFNEGLKLFRQMQQTGTKPDLVTIASVLPSCARVAAQRQGKEIHNHIVRSGMEMNVFGGNALIDMYVKSGSIEDAQKIFDSMSERDVVSWTTMISGYGMHGYGENVPRFFNQMKQTGIQPNEIAFTAVIYACSLSGLVDEGWQFFHSMSQDYCITPKVEHYACMVDLLGRARHLDEAQAFIKRMPLKPTPIVWRALLGACRVHRNLRLGERVAEWLLELEPENVGNYVLLSNVYAATGRWNRVAKIRTMMIDMGLKRRPGYSWIEVKNRVHAFLVGDIWHPQSEKIYAVLESLAKQMEEAGYIADMDFALHDVDEERECILRGHSEKLAIAFGLINTCEGTTLRIAKNLRVCGDCHSATKFLTKICSIGSGSGCTNLAMLVVLSQTIESLPGMIS
eukprot:Gb_03435 [translate_table: standard]